MVYPVQQQLSHLDPVPPELEEALLALDFVKFENISKYDQYFARKFLVPVDAVKEFRPHFLFKLYGRLHVERDAQKERQKKSGYRL